MAVVEEPVTKDFATALALTRAFTPGFLSQLQAVQEKKVSVIPTCTRRKMLRSPIKKSCWILLCGAGLGGKCCCGKCMNINIEVHLGE